MAVVEPTFFDTSVLLSGLIDAGAPDPASRALLVAVAEGRIASPLTAWHCCLELFAVATRLPVELRIDAAVAGSLLETEILARFEVRELGPERHTPFLAAVSQEGIHGGRIYDSHIAEVARTAGAQAVVTNNRRHFVGLLRYGIRVLTAEDLAQELGLLGSG